MFKYGGFKLFLFKIIGGLILLVFGLFLIFSIGTNNPEDSRIDKLQSFGGINYIIGYFSALTSGSFLFLFGLYSYVVSFFFSYIGLLLFFGFLIKNIFFKFFLILASSIFFNQILVATNLNKSDTGIIYNSLELFAKNFFTGYNLNFTESRFFYYALTLISFFLLVVILFYVFNIKVRYFKKLSFLESPISFFFRKIFKVISASFSILIRKSNKKEEFIRRNKSEPVLHKRKSNFLSVNKPKTRKQNIEFDNYYYKLLKEEVKLKHKDFKKCSTRS